MKVDNLLPIPEAALSSHMAAVGKTGSGKTSSLKVIVEAIVARGGRVCILDSIKSDWWGLTSSADGKHPGLPFNILGGPHGHVPLHPSSGKAIAELVATGELPLSIIDMADFPAGGLQHFFVDFAPVLLRKMRGVLWLVLEEAHEFAPKERAGIGDENMALHWAKKIATAGRSKGIRLMVATLRTQALHNAILGSCETLIAHRLTTPADQKPILEWLKANVADKERQAEIAGSLSGLPTGTGWVVSGELQLFEKIAFPRIRTFDNSATPTGDGGQIAVKTAQIDLDHLRTVIGDAVAQAEADDPRVLRKRIAELERAKPATVSAPTAPDPKLSEAAEQRGFERGRGEGLTEGAEVARAMLVKQISDALLIKEPLVFAAPQARPSTAKVAPMQRVPKPAAVQTEPGGLSGPQKKILAALSMWQMLGHPEPSRAMLAAAAGYAPSGGTFKTYLSQLKVADAIDYPRPEFVSLKVDYPAAPLSEVQGTFWAILSGPQQKLVQALEGRQLSRTELAGVAGYEANGGTFKTYLSQLRTLAVIHYPSDGLVELEPWVSSIL